MENKVVFVTGDKAGAQVKLGQTDIDSWIVDSSKVVLSPDGKITLKETGEVIDTQERALPAGNEEIKKLADKNKFEAGDTVVIGAGSYRHYLPTGLMDRPGMTIPDGSELVHLYPHEMKILKLPESDVPGKIDPESVSSKMVKLLSRGVPTLKAKKKPTAEELLTAI